MNPFKIGDKVEAGHLPGTVIEIDGDDVTIQVSETVRDEKYKSFYWSFRLLDADTTFRSDEDIHISFSNMSIADWASKALRRGVNLTPTYQREYCWTLEDKERFLDSVFKKRDLGKFVFIRLPQGKFEVLDGRHRLLTMIEFMKGEFSYRGCKYHELGKKDTQVFDDSIASVAVYPIDSLTEAMKMEVYLLVNDTGVHQPKEHISWIKSELEKLND